MILFSAGNSIPIAQLDTKVVAKYMEDVREKAQAIFIQYKRLYRPGEVIRYFFKLLLFKDLNH